MRLQPRMAAALFCLLVSAAASADESHRAAFLREYTPPPQYMGALDRGYAFQMRQTDFLGEFERVVVAEGVFRKDGFFIKDVSRSRKKKDGPTEVGSNSVEIGNVAYTAMLTAPGGDVYAINSIQLHPADRRADLCFLTGSACELNLDRPFADAVRDSATDVEHYGDSVWQNQPVKALRLGFEVRFPKIGGVRMRNDYFFSPDDGWLCVGFRVRSQAILDDAVYEETVYTFPADRGRWGFIPERVETSLVNERKNTHQKTRVTEVTAVTPRPVAGEEIRLSHFGLPEPVGVDWPQPTPIWVWLVVAGCALGASVAGLRFIRTARVRRQRTSGAAE